jgi:hypothetical protein
MIWATKDDPRILFIDVEPELEIQPDRIMDCTKTDFEARRFHTIFFDPPHGWGEEPGETQISCRNLRELRARRPNRNGLCYYGWDKYGSRSQLIAFIYRAQKEFQRILADDGILWFKWNECMIPVSKVTALMNDWKLMMKIAVESPFQNMGKRTQSWWLLFIKALQRARQTELVPEESRNWRNFRKCGLCEPRYRKGD